MKIPRKKEVKDITIGAGIPDSDPLDNIYPTLKQQYADFSIPADLLGTYVIARFNATLVLENRDGYLYMDAPGGGPQFYLKPVSSTEFENLDGSMHFTFKKEGDQYKSFSFQYFGYDLTAEKME